MENDSSPFNRFLLIVLDGAGIGAMPDAPEWGDAGSDTFGHILESRTVRLPNLQRYGLGNVRPLANVPPLDSAGRLIWPLCITLEWKRHDHRSLGNGRHYSRSGFPHLPEWLPAINSRQVHKRHRRAGNSRQCSRLRNGNHQGAWAKHTSKQASQLFTPRAIQFFRLPLMKKSLSSTGFMRFAKRRDEFSMGNTELVE